MEFTLIEGHLFNVNKKDARKNECRFDHLNVRHSPQVVSVKSPGENGRGGGEGCQRFDERSQGMTGESREYRALSASVECSCDV